MTQDNGSADADKLCDKNQWTDSFLSEKDREACRYINRGLKHIYSITEWKDDTPEKMKKDNREFKQIMLCAALNAYADLLQEKAKDTCPIDDQKIKDMFKKGNGKKSAWCKGNECVECTRDVTYKTCMVGDSSKQTKVEEKLKTILEGDQEIQKTLTSITSINNFCTLLQCVTKKWFTNNKKGQPVTWSEMQKDIEQRATDMFTKISKDSKYIPRYCSNNTEQSSKIVTDPEKQACQYITAGLKHIYEIQEVDSDKDKGKGGSDQKAKDNREFKQTMLCAVLNAYIDKLKQQVKSPCKVDEETIKQVFEKGNEQLTKSCKGKTGQDNNCVQCERVKDLDCTVGGQNTKDKLKDMLSKDKNVEQTLSTISSLNRNLCDSAQCVISQWTRDKREEVQAEKGKNEVWEKDSWNDITQRINPLAKAMVQADTELDNKCNGMQGEKNEACKQIVRGLKHIYGIKKGETKKEPSKTSNRIFKQIMSCFILNVYSDLIKDKCTNTSINVQDLFNVGKDLYTDECKEKPCDPCKWDTCDDMNFNKKNLRNEIKTELQKDEEIQSALEAIKKICQQNAKPPESAQTNADQSGGSSSSGGSKPPAPGGAPAAEKTKDSGELAKKDEVVSNIVPSGKEDMDLPPLEDEDVHHTKSSLDEDEEKWMRSNPKGSHVSVVESSTQLIPEPNVPVGTKNENKVGSSMRDPPTHADIQPPSTGTDTQTPSGSAPQSPAAPATNHVADNEKKKSMNTQDDDTAKSGAGPRGPASTEGGEVIGGQGGQASAGSGTSQDVGTAGNSQDGTADGAEAEPHGEAPGAAAAPGLAGPARLAPRPSIVIPSIHGPRGTGGHGSKVPILKPTEARGPPSAVPISSKIDNLPDLLTPYLPTIPVFLGMSAMSYLLWKYFVLPRKRRRHRRVHQVRAPPTVQEQLFPHVDDQADGPHKYTLVKERRQPRSVPTRTMKPKKQGVGRRVGHRTIIDIHLELLDECQKGDLHSTKEDFFEILVQEFMGSNFIEEQNVPSPDFGFQAQIPDFGRENSVPEEQIFRHNISNEQVPCSDSGFMKENFVPKEGVPRERVPSSDSVFREEDVFPKENVPGVDVPMEQVQNSDSGFLEEDFVPKEEVPKKGVPKEGVPEEDIPKEQVPSLDTGFREENFVPEEIVFLRKNFLGIRFEVQGSGFREEGSVPMKQVSMEDVP
ncbi:SICA antigen [Plasmodium coatneyi]|uniref:SICA antigen n=1 Tax=Plasmodium coatneyi TaxID=208452 RepID=A0A1B1DTS4_9APIC|nr:SICA antigen [Plasmodium coatneyi]ANQ06007.1 SICA antigen [Plasmodium coatneyi]